jgi:hypothetical protein
VSARAAAAGAVLSNLVNNLPAYLAGEAALQLQGHQPVFGLLIGVNVGPVVTPWVSLATLLWMERCRSAVIAVPDAAVRPDRRGAGPARDRRRRGRAAADELITGRRGIPRPRSGRPG